MPAHFLRSAARHSALLVLAGAATALSACGLNLSTDVEAKDQWTRTYPLTADGTLVLSSSNGKIDITGGDGNTITVTAERIVRASTEEVAKQHLASFEMKEEVAPDRVSIDGSTKGISLNVSRRVNYTVTVPRTASITLKSSNGEIQAANIGGHFSAESSNGRISATGLQKSAQVSTSNGVISLTFDHVGGEGIRAETTNGTVTISIPTTTNAELSARVTNGGITHENLNLQVSESSRRRIDGRLGTGGPPIRLETTNGAITIRGK
jgi:DUF4097 and DUF4098 domain-containing protein YvlB